MPHAYVRRTVCISDRLCTSRDRSRTNSFHCCHSVPNWLQPLRIHRGHDWIGLIWLGLSSLEPFIHSIHSAIQYPSISMKSCQDPNQVVQPTAIQQSISHLITSTTTSTTRPHIYKYLSTLNREQIKSAPRPPAANIHTCRSQLKFLSHTSQQLVCIYYSMV